MHLTETGRLQRENDINKIILQIYTSTRYVFLSPKFENMTSTMIYTLDVFIVARQKASTR